MRIGFAGAGFIAGMHAQSLTGQPEVGLKAVFDADAARAQAFAGELNAKAVPSFEALLDAVDVVYICTPNATHAELATAALNAGLHVFSEKPMAISPKEAQEVRKAAERAEGIYQIGFNKRFAPIFTTLKARIEAGDLMPQWAHMKMNRGELEKPEWVADEAMTGGYLYETPIHLLDLSWWLFGPMNEVVCRASQNSARQLDDFAMLLTFESGLTATLCSSAHATWLFPFEQVEVYGPYAAAVTEEMDRVTFQLGLEQEPSTEDVSHLPMHQRLGYQGEDDAFLAAIRGERALAVGAEEGERAVALVDACYRAAETGEAIRVSGP